MNYEQLSTEELRALAKERKISNHHNRRREGLIEHLRQRDLDTGDWQPPDGSLPKLSWSQILDTLDHRALTGLSDALEALDRLSNPQAKAFVSWFSDWQQGKHAVDVPIEQLHGGYCRLHPRTSLNYFKRLLEDTCKVMEGKRWRLSEGHLRWDRPAAFPLSWHVEVWKTSKHVDGGTTASRMVTLLLSGDDA